MFSILEMGFLSRVYTCLFTNGLCTQVMLQKMKWQLDQNTSLGAVCTQKCVG